MGPDPDAICSQIALRDAIRLTYPHKKVFAVGIGVSKFKKYGILDKVDNSTLTNSLLICLDVPNFYRVDGIENLKPKEIIKIDHHPFEETYGNLEWIDDHSSSTCELIARLIFGSNLKLNEKIANNLFIGMVCDSDRFMLSYTSVETFKTVVTLLERSKIDFIKQYSILYERSLEEIRFHGYLSENIKVTENGLGYLKISADTIKKYGVDTATPSNMINDFNCIKDVWVWTFITEDEKNDIYKVYIRSRGPVINEIASKYNGGGHKFASGVRAKTMDEIDQLLKDLDDSCKNYKKSL